MTYAVLSRKELLTVAALLRLAFLILPIAAYWAGRQTKGMEWETRKVTTPQIYYAKTAEGWMCKQENITMTDVIIHGLNAVEH